MSRAACMTLAEINRMIRAAIRAARQEGCTGDIEVKIGDEAAVRIPLAADIPTSDKPVAQGAGIVL